MNSQADWLHTRIREWVHDGIIDEATATTLRQRHPLSKTDSRGFSLVTAIGAIVFGLGVILFFAFNWSEFSKYTKLAIIFTTLITSHGIGIAVRIKRPDNTHLIEGFHLIGTMMFGAGIWLIAQIYHMNEHYPTAFFLWGLGALAFAWLIPSVFQGVLSCILLGTWGLSEVIAFNSVHLLSVLIIALGIIPLAWRLRSCTLLFFGTLFSITVLLSNIGSHLSASLQFFAAFVIALLLINVNNIARKSSFQHGIDLVSTMGVMIYGAVLFSITVFSVVEVEDVFLLEFSESSSTTALTLFWIFYAIALIFCARQFFRDFQIAKNSQSEVGNSTVRMPLHQGLILISTLLMGCQAAGVFSSDALLENFWPVAVLLYNLVLLAHCILLIIRGTEDLNAKHVVLGFAVIAILIYMRFNDLFHSLLLRSLVFLVLGATLFAVGHYYSKRKAQIESAQLEKDDSTAGSPGAAHA